MATPFAGEQPRGTAEHEKKMVELAGAGAATGAFGAAAAVVLSIVGLAGVLATAMMSIATIVLGAAFLLDAGAVGARYRKLARECFAGEERLARLELGGGISAGSCAGIAGIVLGILALLGLTPVTLCAVALIAFGAAMLFGSAAKGRLASLGTSVYGLSDKARHVIDETMRASAGAEVFVGVGAVVLGILALLGFAPLTLVLVGFLGVGAVELLGESAFGARMVGIMRHAH
jgi:hypothetical protein